MSGFVAPAATEATFSIEDATPEDKLLALSQWWQRHCKVFTTWYLSLSSEKQRELLLKAVPDMPETSVHERQGQVQATDLILPEFSLDGMLSTNGRIFILFMTRRMVGSDLCMQEDIRLLNDLYANKKLPSFSNNALEQMDTAFVDPLDSEENIRSLSATTSAETREVINGHLAINRLIRAEVWLALKLRRSAIAALLELLIEEYYAVADVKPSPTYQSLLLGELAQQAALYNSESQEASTTAEKDGTSV